MFWGTGEMGIYFRGTGEQMPTFEGNRGTKTILGNREHKKTNFQFLGNRGTSQFISGEQGDRNPLGGPPACSIQLLRPVKCRPLQIVNSIDSRLSLFLHSSPTWFRRHYILAKSSNRPPVF